MQPNISEPILS